VVKVIQVVFLVVFNMLLSSLQVRESEIPREAIIQAVDVSSAVNSGVNIFKPCTKQPRNSNHQTSAELSEPWAALKQKGKTGDR